MNATDNGTPSTAGLRQQRDPWLDVFLSKPVLLLGTLLALISVVDGIRNSILHSLDFQWSPALLLTQHIDPWATYLAGDPAHRILLNQVPNYLHELYVAMLPFGYMPWSSARLVWAVVNLLLILLSCVCVARLYELENRKAWLLTVLVLAGTPARVTIGNGQVTGLVLAVLALWAVTASASGRGLLLGVAWAKYSVPPVLAAFLLLRRRWRLLFFSLLPPLAGFLFFYTWLRTPFWTLLLEPFRTSANNVSPGLANVMAICEIALRHPPFFQAIPDALYLSPQAGWAFYLPYICGVALAFGMAAYFSAHCGNRSGKCNIDGRILLACLMAASLACFKHQIYDFLFLIFSLAVALQAGRSFVRNGLFVGIAYFWYLERLIHIRRWEFWPAVVIFSFVLLIALIAVTWRLRSSVDWTARWKL